jgi:hypothetical protein
MYAYLKEGPAESQQLEAASVLYSSTLKTEKRRGSAVGIAAAYCLDDR